MVQPALNRNRQSFCCDETTEQMLQAAVKIPPVSAEGKASCCLSRFAYLAVVAVLSTVGIFAIKEECVLASATFLLIALVRSDSPRTNHVAKCECRHHGC